jgi:nitrogen-specific signal transduction histidine kinase
MPSNPTPLPAGSNLCEFVLDAINAGVVALDAEGIVRYANRSARQELGLPAGEVGNVGIAELLPAGAWRSAAGDAPGGATLERRCLVRLSDAAAGTSRTIGFTVVRPSSGRPDATAILVLRCMDEVQQLEQARLRGEQAEALGRLVAGLAHEVRNPLATLRALCESLLVSVGVNDERAEFAQRALQAVRRIEGFVRAAVRFAHVRAARRERHAADQLLSAAIVACGSPPVAVQRPAESRGGPCCEVDREQVVECLAALVSNAVEAASHPAKVGMAAVEVSPVGGQRWVRFSVSDDGPGVPAASSARVFEPFFTTKPGRTGMGLALAQSFAHQNGGRVELAREGPNPEFALWLPMVSS